MAHSDRRVHEVSTATALSVLLDHPAVTSDQQIVCKLLQVCKAWRTAVHQSDAAFTNISIDISSQVVDLPKLAHLAAWISTHPSLKRTISITSSLRRRNEQHHIDTYRRILELGLRLAAAGTSKAAEQRPTAGAVPLGAGFRSHHRWVLQSFKCDLETSPAMLAALPAATLTRLALSCIKSSEMQVIAASIQGLPRLQELVAISHKVISGQPSAAHKLLAAVDTLKQLRILHLGCLQDMACLQQLPRQLQQLTVQVTPAEVPIRIALGHLTSLQRLEFRADCGMPPGSVLPANLTFLRLATHDRDPIGSFGITKLQQLQYLSMDRAMLELQTLAAMSQLHLTDQDTNVWNDTSYAQVWSQLSILRSLGVCGDCLDPGQIISLCTSAGKATSITSLNLQLASTFEDLDDDAADLAASLEPCLCLTKLLQLQDLSLTLPLGDDTMTYVCLAQHDVLHLTSLTGLTRLHVTARGGADDTVVCALVGALTRLRHLSLPFYRLSTAPLPSMGLLKGLQHLGLSSYQKAEAEFGLKFLTGLRGLTHLNGFDKAGQGALTSFWAAVRGHQRQ